MIFTPRTYRIQGSIKPLLAFSDLAVIRTVFGDIVDDCIQSLTSRIVVVRKSILRQDQRLRHGDDWVVELSHDCVCV